MTELRTCQHCEGNCYNSSCQGTLPPPTGKRGRPQNFCCTMCRQGGAPEPPPPKKCPNCMGRCEYCSGQVINPVRGRGKGRPRKYCCSTCQSGAYLDNLWNNPEKLAEILG